MYNSYITSSIALRTRGFYPFSYNDYSFAYSSSGTSWCCCTSNSMYRMPVTPSYCYDLYACRQSSLIQWSPCRKLCLGGVDRCYYSRLPPTCDVDRKCCCCGRGDIVREKSVGGRKGGLRKCVVIEERSGRYDVGNMDEVESILSLLTDDVGEECFRVRRESKRLVKKPVAEKREDGGVKSRCVSKKKRNDLGYLDNEARFEYELVESSSRKRDNRRGERAEKKENRKASKVDEKREALVRRASQQEEEEIEGEESLLRKENSNARERVRAKEEEKEESLRRDEHRHRMRKDGSSCSSYYSVSSTGDYESDNEVELKEERLDGNSSIRHENVVRNEIDYQRRADYKEDIGVSLTKKESNASSSVVESDFRKKSEKKLIDSSVEDVVSRKGTIQKESEISVIQESGYGKSSMKNEDSKVKSTASSKLDLQKQVSAQTGIEVSRQSESRMKYKQLAGNQDTISGNVIQESGYGSQRLERSKDEISSKAANSSQTAVRFSKRQDEIQRKSQKATVVSDTTDVDIRKLSISLQEFETNVKRTNDYSSSTFSSAYDAERKRHEVSEQVEQRRKSEQLTKGDNKSSLMIQSDNKLKFIKQGENVNLSFGSSMGSEKQQSRSHAYLNKREDTRYQSDEVNNTSISQSGNSSAIAVKENDKSESGITATSSHFVSHEDAIGSAAQLQESSKHYVGEFVDNVRHEMMSSKIQMEKETDETKLKVGKSSIQNASVDSESKEYEASRMSQGSGNKGPSAEMWKVDEPSIGEQSKSEIQEDANKDSGAIVMRNGRSLWNVIGDVFRLRWSPRSESQSTSGKTGSRSSPNQSTGSETFFSGHEGEEIEEVAGKKESKIMTEELASEIHQEEEKHGSSTLVGISAPSSSVAIGSGSSPISIHSPFTGESSRSNFGGTANASASKLRRSPVVRSVSEGGEANLSESDTNEQLIHSPFTGESSRSKFGGTSNASASKLRRSPVVRSVSEGGEANISESDMNEQLNSGLVEQSGLALDEGEQKGRRMLQRKDQIVRDQFDEWEDAYRFDAEQRKVDEMFMREALLEAQKAGDNWEVPVGAVLVHNGKIIARGYNLVEELRDSTAHAEMICIREGSNLLRTWRLSETTLYVTLEPCPMCAGAILQARVDTVVWGAPNKLLGADGSWIRLFPNGGGGNELEQQSNKRAAPVHPFHPKIIIRRGVLSSECAETMQQFFQLRRKRKDKKPVPESSSSAPPSSRLSISHHPSKLLKKMHHAFNITFCL